MKYFAIALVRLYQLTISPLLGTTCRFYPSCSHYSLEAFRQRGFFVGFFLTLIRVCKCGPWHPGGIDEVPIKKQQFPLK